MNKQGEKIMVGRMIKMCERRTALMIYDTFRTRLTL